MTENIVAIPVIEHAKMHIGSSDPHVYSFWSAYLKGAEDQKREDMTRINAIESIVPRICACCIGCELEGEAEDGCVHSFVLSASRAKEYIAGLKRPKRARWVHLGGDEWFCSGCCEVIFTEGSWEHPLDAGKKYCETCGAQMEAE